MYFHFRFVTVGRMNLWKMKQFNGGLRAFHKRNPCEKENVTGDEQNYKLNQLRKLRGE